MDDAAADLVEPDGHFIDFVDLPTGTFLMGNEDEVAYSGDGEGPVRRVSIGSLAIAKDDDHE